MLLPRVVEEDDCEDALSFHAVSHPWNDEYEWGWDYWPSLGLRPAEIWVTGVGMAACLGF